MVKELSEIIVSTLSFCGLFWVDKEPSWITGKMLVQNDPNLQDYFGEWSLQHFYRHLSRRQEHRSGSIIGVYPLDMIGGKPHLHQPENLRNWQVWHDRSLNVAAALRRMKALGGIPITKESKTETRQGLGAYRFVPKESSKIRDLERGPYLYDDQVKYIESLRSLKELTITYDNDTSVLFRGTEFFAAIAAIDPKEIKDYLIGTGLASTRPASSCYGL